MKGLVVFVFGIVCLTAVAVGCNRDDGQSGTLNAPTGAATGTANPTREAPTEPATPRPKLTPRPTPAPTPDNRPCKVRAAANPWGYDFCFPGRYITAPASEFCSYFPCIGNFWNGNGYVIQCSDGTFGKSGGKSGSCNHHGGNASPLYSH